MKFKKNEKTNERFELDAHELEFYGTLIKPTMWHDIYESCFPLKREVALNKVLMIIEDVGQAEYTSMHASLGDDFYFDDSEFFLGIDEIGCSEWNEIEQNIVFPLRIKHYIQQLERQDKQVGFITCAEKTKYYNELDKETIIQINQQPIQYFDDEIKVKIAEVANDALKLDWFLNGYFSCDFDPYENYALINCMNSYGFEFMGIGASLLVWVKTEHFSIEKIEDLLCDLAHVYHLNENHQDKIRQHILENNYLILPYGESLEHFS